MYRQISIGVPMFPSPFDSLSLLSDSSFSESMWDGFVAQSCAVIASVQYNNEFTNAFSSFEWRYSFETADASRHILFSMSVQINRFIPDSNPSLSP
jgi:hypothetical protein